MTQLGEGSASASPIEIPEPKKSEAPPQQQKKPITLRISVFFDGTNNNRANVLSRHEDTELYRALKLQKPDGKGNTKASSFEVDLTNIATLESQFEKSTGYDHHMAVYVEGVGTRDLKKVTEDFERYRDKFLSTYTLPPKAYETAKKKYGMTPEEFDLARCFTWGKEIATDSNVLGMAMGISSTGVYAKCDAGMAKVVEAYQKLTRNFKQRDYEVTKLCIDVFGFSRGSATARYFIHFLLNGKRHQYTWKSFNYRPKLLQREIVQHSTLHEILMRQDTLEIRPDAIEIGFAGLFDTVAAHINATTSDVEPLYLHAVTEAKKVYHLAASDEHRVCFALTDISSVRGKTGEEYYFPGVHADIGGGYRELGAEEENFTLAKSQHSLLNIVPNPREIVVGKYPKVLKKLYQQLQDEGWYQNREGEPPEITLEESALGMRSALKTHRTRIKNTYCLIFLHLMVEEAQRNGIYMKAKLKNEFKVPQELKQVERELRAYMARVGQHSKPEDWFEQTNATIHANFDIEKLRHEHLHYSSREATGYWPRFVGNHRRRKIYHG